MQITLKKRANKGVEKKKERKKVTERSTLQVKLLPTTQQMFNELSFCNSFLKTVSKAALKKGSWSLGRLVAWSPDTLMLIQSKYQ